MRQVTWLVLAVACAGCDTVRDHYDTLEDARADRLFERGWLPDVLPDSAVDIHAANDLDIGTSRSRFDYRVGDDAALFAALQPGAPAQAPFDDWAYLVAKQSADGRLPWTLHRDGSTWVFFCDRGAGHCETWLWSGP